MSKKIYVDKPFIENLLNTKGKKYIKSMAAKNVLIFLDQESDDITTKII